MVLKVGIFGTPCRGKFAKSNNSLKATNVLKAKQRVREEYIMQISFLLHWPMAVVFFHIHVKLKTLFKCCKLLFSKD